MVTKETKPDHFSHSDQIRGATVNKSTLEFQTLPRSLLPSIELLEKTTKK